MANKILNQYCLSRMLGVFERLDKIAKNDGLRDRLIELSKDSLDKGEYNSFLNYGSYKSEIETCKILLERMKKENERVQRVHRDAPRTRGGSRY